MNTSTLGFTDNRDLKTWGRIHQWTIGGFADIWSVISRFNIADDQRVIHNDDPCPFLRHTLRGGFSDSEPAGGGDGRNCILDGTPQRHHAPKVNHTIRTLVHFSCYRYFSNNCVCACVCVHVCVCVCVCVEEERGISTTFHHHLKQRCLILTLLRRGDFSSCEG